MNIFAKKDPNKLVLHGITCERTPVGYRVIEFYILRRNLPLKDEGYYFLPVKTDYFSKEYLTLSRWLEIRKTLNQERKDKWLDTLKKQEKQKNT